VICCKKPHMFNFATPIKEQASLGMPLRCFPDSPVVGFVNPPFVVLRGEGSETTQVAVI